MKELTVKITLDEDIDALQEGVIRDVILDMLLGFNYQVLEVKSVWEAANKEEDGADNRIIQDSQ